MDMDTLLEVIRRRKGKGYKASMEDDSSDKESDSIEGDGSVKSRQSKQQEDADGLAPKLKGDSENIEQVEQKNEEIEKRPTAEQLLGRKPMSTTKSRDQEDDASELDGEPFPDKTIFNEDALEQMINPVLQEQLSEGRKPKTLKDRVQMNIMKVMGKKKKTNQGEMNDDE